ncbi:MAG: autotransporter strand-loop-strand O-heptosyltransferase [Quinella sp. 1Q7]|nr:autotransporter strand-loop-strand O-heptosyltransferase [Quinella sp. 1Q7]
MRTLFFCARDFSDYIVIENKRETLARLGNVTVRDLLNDDATQKFFRSKMNFYADCESALSAPIVGKTDVDGLRLDFNFGLRLEVPTGNFHVTISDAVGGQIFLNEDLSDVRLISVEKYFIRWQVDVSLSGRKIFSHTFDAAGQTVTVVSRLTGMGDIISLLPHVRAFKQFHHCDVRIWLHEYMREFAAHLYPDLPQIDAVTFDGYATYYPTMCINDYPQVPFDVRNEPLERGHRKIFGLDVLPPKPTFKPTMPPIIREPYVCIGVQASTTIKGWHYPNGWEIVVDRLKRLGYRVFCIDRHAVETNDNRTIKMPANAEDFTGDFTIMERANMLYHAEFFIGLSSGLAWLAYAVNCPVVMICGFSQDWFEFYTPYRVANRLVCNGCFNDVRVNFVWDVCPYHKGTSRELECQNKITPRQVLSAIEHLIADRGLTPLEVGRT